jgi:hypothetical protein
MKSQTSCCQRKHVKAPDIVRTQESFQLLWQKFKVLESDAILMAQEEADRQMGNWERCGHDLFEVLSWDLLGGAEENNEESCPG